METIWIDAAEFADYGGFTLETQFVQEMGQAYLLALDKPGIPVQSAHTEFTTAESGVYKIWIRTKNWLRGYAPGRLETCIDHTPLPVEIGTQPNGQWYWEICGEIKLCAGRHTIEIADTTGYFGRFSALVVSSDFDYVPEQNIDRMRKERALLKGESTKPLDAGQYDLIVAGAGPGGVPAALSAARGGLKVALISSRPGLGGNASDEGTVGFDGAGRHFGMRESGISEEVRRMHEFEHLSWEGAMRKLVEAEKNITVFYNLFVTDAQVTDGVITKITALNGIEMRIYEFKGELFADCTGDGWLGYYAGAKYRLGSESRREFGESLAPEIPDGGTMSGCLMGMYQGHQVLGYYAQDAGHPVPFQAPAWAVQLPEGDDLHRSPGRLNTGEWWIENATDWDDLWDQETVRDELLRLNLGYFHWLKNSYARRELTRNLEIVAFGKYNARRENRRIVGDYILTENDCVEGVRFKDAVSYCGWTLDVHHPKGIYSGAEGPYYSDAPVKLCTIPYRCLYSKNIKNLFMAGRCASVSHIALGTTRVESTIATLGQVVGTAAAMCHNRHQMPRDIYTNSIVELQQKLLLYDLYIPGVKNTDPDDLAKTASLRASSTGKVSYVSRRGVATGWEEAKTDLVMSCDYDPKMDRAELKLRNTREEELRVPVSLVTMPGSGQYEHMEELDRVTVTVPAAYEGFLPVQFPSGIAGRQIRVIGIRVGAADGLCWQKVDYCSDGRKRGKPIGGRFWETDNSNSYQVKFMEEPNVMASTEPEQTVNGQNRILDASYYAWVSDDGLPQDLDLTWEKDMRIGRVILVLDTDLANPAYSYLAQSVVPETLKDIDIVYYDEDGNEQVAAQIRNNYQRRVEVTFAHISTKHLRIRAIHTWGSSHAKIIEVRVY